MATVPHPHNERILDYAPGSPERATLKAELETLAKNPVDIPLFIGGREVRPGATERVRSPHNHALTLGTLHQGGAAETAQAIDAAKAASRGWAETPLSERLAVFLRAADLLSGPRRATLCGATMLGQSKTAYQAEIDAACELADFWRWNAWFAERIANEQPASSPGMWNQLEARPLEGFIFAVSPFNFTAIGGNLPTAPAMLGNTVVWKPAPTAALSAYYTLQILREAGLPDGVINVVHGAPVDIGNTALLHPDLAGVHFTGSTGVFQHMWQQVGAHIASYRTYPRLVGETGGKDFIVVHASARDDLDRVATAIVRGGYEYQGQKCSAASRIYVPSSLWPALRERLVSRIAELKVGDVGDFSNFMGAVIDEKAFARISGYLAYTHATPSLKVLAGGKSNGERGWFVEPTLVESADPKSRLMQEEIFGPVVTVHVYDETQWFELLSLVDDTSPYALTGAVFSRDRAAIEDCKRLLLHAAGNFYINDKPSGAVVGQQPFGGARASGTNDKAGSLWNMIRWTSPRTIKETFAAPTSVGFPYMLEP